MNEFITSMLVLAAEFGAVIIILFLIVMVFLFIRNRKEVSMADNFLEQFRASTKSRKKSLGKEISETFSIDNEAGETYASIILNKERTLCANVLRIFRGKDRSVILTFQDDLADLSGTYYELANAGEHNSVVVKEADNNTEMNQDDEMLTTEINLLREENTRLRDDLKKSLENVDYLQQQYTELFDKTRGQKGS